MPEPTLRQTSYSWLVRRNPTYLLSALCIAAGARMLLAPDETGAGQWEKVAGTLAALQFYEWAICAVLVALSRARRAPEDRPSLLVLAALFWTGPLVATMEVNAQSRAGGFVLGIGVCLIALGELRALTRLLDLRLDLPTQLAAACCPLLVAVAQPLLKISPDGGGTNELLLYVLWWVLAAIFVAALAPRRQPPPRHALALTVISIAATAAHLTAMNYAFFGHMRPFYVAPLLVAFGIVGMAWPMPPKLRRWLRPLAAGLPAVAIVLARRSFAADIAIETIPSVLRDPLRPVLFLAAAAWIFGFIRQRTSGLLHAGVVTLVFLVFRAFPAAPEADDVATVPFLEVTFTANRLSLTFYILTGYLLLTGWLRHSRAAVLGALVTHIAAVGLLVWGALPSDGMIVALLVGWSGFFAVHITVPRPSPQTGSMPAAALVLMTGLFALDEQLVWAARLHAVMIVVVLAAWGTLQPATRYRRLAVAVAAVEILPIAFIGLRESRGLRAAGVVLSGFALLLLGAWVSWNKDRLLGPPAPSREPKADEEKTRFIELTELDEA